MPAFEVVNEMLDILLETKTSQAAAELGLEGHGGKERAWVAPLADNRRRWKEQCQPTTKGNHNAILAGFDYTISHSNLLLNESMALLRIFPHTRSPSDGLPLTICTGSLILSLWCRLLSICNRASIVNHFIYFQKVLERHAHPRISA